MEPTQEHVTGHYMDLTLQGHLLYILLIITSLNQLFIRSYNDLIIGEGDDMAGRPPVVALTRYPQDCHAKKKDSSKIWFNAPV